MLNISGEGWTVHTDANNLDVTEGIGYDIGTSHYLDGKLPGFVAHFVPAGETVPTHTQVLTTARKTPFQFQPFGAACKYEYGVFPSGTAYSTTCGTDPELQLAVGDVNVHIHVKDYCKYANSGFIAKKGWNPTKAGTLSGANGDLLESVGVQI